MSAVASTCSVCAPPLPLSSRAPLLNDDPPRAYHRSLWLSLSQVTREKRLEVLGGWLQVTSHPGTYHAYLNTTRTKWEALEVKGKSGPVDALPVRGQSGSQRFQGPMQYRGV
jgi:hypothetical protein